MHRIVVIHHLILPGEPIDTLAIASSIWTIELLHTSLVSFHVAVEITVAGDGFVASWVLATVAARRHVAWVDPMRVLLSGSLDLVCGILHAWAWWSSDSHLKLLSEMNLGISIGLEGMVGTRKRKT